jgi:hypothetical protein
MVTRFLKIALAALASLLYIAAGTGAVAQFETRASFSTAPHYPISLAAGDFNRDGKLDVAVISYDPNPLVMILLGNGDGTFRRGASYSVGEVPLYATAASLRNNGILDLVVGDNVSGDVNVMLGNGDGTFQPPIAYPASAEAEMVGTGDFTGDGILDIIGLAPQGGCNCVVVLPGNGDGTFGSAVITPVPYGVIASAMATGFFNADEKLDVAVTGGFYATYQVDILLGNGDGSFRPHGYYLTSPDPYSVAAGRFTGAKTTDLAVGGFEANDIGVLLGNGNGSFQQAVNYPNPGFVDWAAVGDLNGDGKEDLVGAGSNSSSTGLITVQMGNGDGTFQPAVAYPAGAWLNYVAIGDFNGDHQPDLVTVDRGSSTDLPGVITLLNTGVVTFSPTTPITFPSELLGTTSTPLSATLTNNGNSPLAISSVTFSGSPFHAQTTCRNSVPPGGNCSITATFTAQTAGIATGTVTIHDSASSKPQVVELVGTGTEVKLSPTQLTFPPQKKGTKSAPQSIQVTNIGSTAFAIEQIYVSEIGVNHVDFKEFNNCPASLNAGAGCTVEVIFAPEVPGSIIGSIVFSDTGGGSPQQVALSGTGD